MIESCTKKRMLIAVTFLGGSVLISINNTYQLENSYPRFQLLQTTSDNNLRVDFLF